jgi:hypothetical protein
MTPMLAWLAPGEKSKTLLEKLKSFLFEPWQGEWLVRDKFEDLSYGFAIALALGTAALLIVEVFARRAGFRIPKKVVAGVGITITLLGFLSYFGFFNPNVRYAKYYHRHEFFHYYLGSKYSKELGYSRLYECTAVAEVELGQRAKIAKQEIRDLRAENLIVPMKDTYVLTEPEKCTSHFSKGRWDAFKADVKWMESASRGSYWDNMKKDHGYNPPPVWTMQGKLFSMLGPAEDRTFKLLASVDVLLHIGTLVMVGWAFGWRVLMVLSVFWGCNTAGCFYWTGGAFLRQDWIFLLVGSLCLAKKRYFGLAGAAFVWSGLLRIFPLAAGFGWLVLIALYFLRHRSFHRDHLRFLAGGAIAAALLIPSSIAVSGAASYKEFAHHISLHKNTPLTNHMGLETMVVHDWDGRMRFTRNEAFSDQFQPWKEGRIQRKHARLPLMIAIWLTLAGWIVWALHRTQHFWLGLPLSIPLLISLTNLTCYYFVVFIAFAALVRVRPSLAPAFLATAAGSQVLLTQFYWIDDRYTALSYLFFAFGLVPLVVFSRLPSPKRVAAFLQSLWPKATAKPQLEPNEN